MTLHDGIHSFDAISLTHTSTAIPLLLTHTLSEATLGSKKKKKKVNMAISDGYGHIYFFLQLDDI